MNRKNKINIADIVFIILRVIHKVLLNFLKLPRNNIYYQKLIIILINK